MGAFGLPGWTLDGDVDGGVEPGRAGAEVDPPRPPVRAIVRADPRRTGVPAAGSTIVAPAGVAADARPAAPVGTATREAGAAGRLTLGVEAPPAAGHDLNATRPVATSSDTRAAPISDAALPAPRADPGYAAEKAPGTTPTQPFRPFGPVPLASWRVGAHRPDAATARGEPDPEQPGDHHREALELRRRQARRARRRCGAGTRRGSARGPASDEVSANRTPGRNAVAQPPQRPGDAGPSPASRRSASGARSAVGRHRAVRIGHRPRPVPGLAVVAVAGELAADAPDRVAEGERGRADVEQRQRRGSRAATPTAARRSRRRSAPPYQTSPVPLKRLPTRSSLTSSQFWIR